MILARPLHIKKFTSKGPQNHNQSVRDQTFTLSRNHHRDKVCDPHDADVQKDSEKPIICSKCREWRIDNSIAEVTGEWDEGEGVQKM